MKTSNCMRVAALLLVCMLLFSILGCQSTLRGTYKTDGLVAQTMTFTNDGSVIVSAFGLDFSGQYKIEKDEITVTYTVLGVTNDWTESFRRDGDKIYIGGVCFTKQ